MIELKIGKQYQLDSETSVLLGFSKETKYKIIGVTGATVTIQIGDKTVSMTSVRLIDHSTSLDETVSYNSYDFIPPKMLAAQQALQKKMDQQNKENPMPKPEIVDPKIEKSVVDIPPKPIEQPIIQPEMPPSPPVDPPAQPEVNPQEQPDIPNEQPVVPSNPVIETPVTPTSPDDEDDSNPYGRYI